MKEELIPSRPLSSMQLLMEPNQASPPTHPHLFTLAPFALWRVSVTCWWITSPQGRCDILLVYSFFAWSPCAWTISWCVMIPLMNSAPFLTMVPELLGLCGLKVMLGNPPVALVFGRQPHIDSSKTKYITSVSPMEDLVWGHANIYCLPKQMGTNRQRPGSKCLGYIVENLGNLSTHTTILSSTSFQFHYGPRAQPQWQVSHRVLRGSLDPSDLDDWRSLTLFLCTKASSTSRHSSTWWSKNMLL